MNLQIMELNRQTMDMDCMITYHQTILLKVSVRVKARDPVFVNPNSYTSIIEVLQSIGKDLAVDKYVPESSRKWAVVVHVCDGLPYSLCNRVLKETFRCKECHNAVFTKSALKKHMSAAHHIQDHNDDIHILEFDWVLVCIGYGHYEMNMVSL